MARIVRFYRTGGPEVLEIEDVDLAPPSVGEVQIRIRALGINRAEAMFRSGVYLEEPQLPARLGYEAAGTVEAVGEGVEDYKPGDAVNVIPGFSMNTYGVYGDAANVPASALVPHPTSLSWTEAAAVWMMFTTAYGALIDIAALQSGDKVVIPAASSSVGLAAIQITNRAGAVPVALTRNSSKHAALKAAGAAHVIVTSEQDLVDEVQRITEGKGARVVFDPVGGPMVEKLAAAMSERGVLFQYGALSPEPTPLPLMSVLGKSLTIRGYLVFEITTDPQRLELAKAFINDGIEFGNLKPAVAKTFALEEIVEAHRFMESNQQIGKIVVTV
jgi:NADPH:quinone reductase-like Zn-dependent oxidoreductase